MKKISATLNMNSSIKKNGSSLKYEAPVIKTTAATKPKKTKISVSMMKPKKSKINIIKKKK